MPPGAGEDPLHQAGDLGLETLQDVQPGGEQGPGEEGGQGVVQPLDQAPVPHAGRRRQDGPHPLGGLVNTQPPQDRLLVCPVSQWPAETGGPDPAPSSPRNNTHDHYIEINSEKEKDKP